MRQRKSSAKDVVPADTCGARERDGGVQSQALRHAPTEVWLSSLSYAMSIYAQRGRLSLDHIDCTMHVSRRAWKTRSQLASQTRVS